MFRDPVSSNPFIAMSKGGGGGGSKSPQPPFVDPMLTVSSPDVMAAFFAQQLAQHAAHSAMPVAGGSAPPSGPQVVRRGPGGGVAHPFSATGGNHNQNNGANTFHRQRGVDTNATDDLGVTKSAPAAVMGDSRAGAKTTQSNSKQHQQQQHYHQASGTGHHHHHHHATTMPPTSLSALEKEELLARTVHLRFLPTGMKQGDLASMCTECGPVLRVRICGGQNHNNHNWIYGFVEFANTAAAHRMMRKSGMELFNGPSKPPLRLKCHSAREPIVDRVFHDADPSRGVACQFGHGAFAQRTLREALDSYFSLVNKSGGAQALKEELLLQQHQRNQHQSPPTPTSHKAPQQPNATSVTVLSGGGGGETDTVGGSSLGSIAWSQLPLPLSPEVVVGGNRSSFSVESSATSSVNGRTSSNPPSPQPAQHGAIGTPTSFASTASATAAAVAGLMGSGASVAAATAVFSLPPSLAVGPLPSVSTPPSQQQLNASHPNRSGFHRDACHAVVNKLLGLLDAAMRAGSEFAATGNVTKFYDAMQPLQALHETIHAVHQARQETSSPNAAGGGGTTSPGRSLTEYSMAAAATTVPLPPTTLAAAAAGDAAAAQSDAVRFENDIRCIRISAFLIASFLHVLRGSLSDMLPCITRALDIIAEVSMAPVPKPADLELGHEDDEEAFLSALSLVHVVQPAALVSREVHRNAVQHQEFLCNALMALGFGVEDCNSLIARCAYTAARRRAHSALGLSNPVLDHALCQGGVHNLRFSVGGLPNDSAVLGKDTGKCASSAFVIRFFDSYGMTAAKASSTRSPGGNSPSLQHQAPAILVMDELPPLHCARVFSQRSV